MRQSQNTFTILTRMLTGYSSRIIKSMLVILPIIFSHGTVAQQQETLLGKLTGLEQLARNIIDHGFDRADQSIIAIGNELNAFVGAARVNLDDILDHGGDEYRHRLDETIASIAIYRDRQCNSGARVVAAGICSRKLRKNG